MRFPAHVQFSGVNRYVSTLQQGDLGPLGWRRLVPRPNEVRKVAAGFPSFALWRALWNSLNIIGKLTFFWIHWTWNNGHLTGPHFQTRPLSQSHWFMAVVMLTESHPNEDDGVNLRGDSTLWNRLATGCSLKTLRLWDIANVGAN